MNIIMIASGSSAFLAYGYNPESQQLKMEFNGGKKIVYKGVPPEEWEAFQRASSKGQHYNKYIKGVYQVDESATQDTNK